VADILTLALRHADAWEPWDGDDDVIDRIYQWHSDEGLLPAPADHEFANARWFVPKGTSFEARPDRDRADKLLVKLPNGDRYMLSIDHEGDLRGDSWHEITYFVVERAFLASRQELCWTREREQQTGAARG
jgi:hypothetical protein